MKSLFSAVVLAVFAYAVAAPAEQNFDTQFNSLASTLDSAAKKIKELPGLKKEQFSELLTQTSNKMVDDFKQFNENILKNSTSVPEDLKNKYNDLVQKFGSTIKDLSSPEAQKKSEEFQNAVLETVKNLGSQVNDLSKSFAESIPTNVQNIFGDMFKELNTFAKNIQVS